MELFLLIAAVTVIVFLVKTFSASPAAATNIASSPKPPQTRTPVPAAAATSQGFKLDVEALKELLAAVKKDPERIKQFDGWDNAHVAIENLQSMIELRGSLRNSPNAKMYQNIDSPDWYEFHIMTGNAYGIDVLDRPNKVIVAPEDRVLPDLPGRKPETPLGRGLKSEVQGNKLKCQWEGHDVLKSLESFPEKSKITVHLTNGNHFLTTKMQELICVHLGATSFVMHDRTDNEFTDSYDFTYIPAEFKPEEFLSQVSADTGAR